VRRKRGKKIFIIAIAVIIGLIWFFATREVPLGDDVSHGEFSKHVSRLLNTLWTPFVVLDIPIPHENELDTKPPAMPSPPSAPADLAWQSDDEVPHPHPHPSPLSFETDPDPSKTVHCSQPHEASLPLVQYALMIDAGSTGSRIHVYKFNNCGSSPMYEYEVFMNTQPGLSSYKGAPLQAAQSLDVLLDEAVRVVPEALRKCTPVAVKATAGLRLLGSEESTLILEAVETRLHAVYPFPVQEKGGVVIMDGKDEGVYAWITANYLLKTIRSDTPPDTSTYAVLDLGGASTQIVFKPMFSKPDSSLVEGEHKYDLTFGGKTHILYQHSYLGYGLKRARSSVHRLVDFVASLRNNDNATVIGNPCLAQGTRKVVEVEDERTGIKRNVTMAGEDVGSFEACNRIVELVLAKDAYVLCP
jgi:guanosine-diphosphatase